MKCPVCSSEEIKILEYKQDGAVCECQSCEEKFQAGV